jgi:capsular exopolysaccharide synthesis family protein
VQQGSEALNLHQALDVLRRRLLLIALCAVVVAGAAFAYSKHQPRKYTATAALVFSNNPLSQQIAGLPPSSTANLLEQQASDLELVKLGDMAVKTASLLGRGLTAAKVASNLSIAGQGESSVVDVSATATSPTLAAAIANTYTHEFVTEQQGSNQRYFRSALKLVDKQLAAIPPNLRFSAAAVTLQGRAQTLRLLEELKYGNVQVAQTASAPTAPSSPKTSRNTLLGLVLGLILGLGLAFVLERFYRDRRLTGPEDMEAVHHAPLLGVVPESAALARAARRPGERAALPPAEAEAFHLIRARLRFFDVSRNLCTVLIASAQEGDGKTTIARHLAEAAAGMGSRVLLVEADLRHPALSRQLGTPPEPGLPDVLIGAVGLHEAIRSIDLPTLFPSRGDLTGRSLDVLACGAVLPPNPRELLESHAMKVVLERAKATYDLVVIDTPPLTAVADAFPLLNEVDGVVIVSRAQRSRRDAAELLRQTLERSGALRLGVIANGARSNVTGLHAYATERGAATPSAAAEPTKTAAAIAMGNGAAPHEQPVPTARS